MSASQPTDLTLDQALKILKSYDCAQVTKTEPLLEPEKLRNSLLLITSLSTFFVHPNAHQDGHLKLTSNWQTNAKTSPARVRFEQNRTLMTIFHDAPYSF